MYCADTTVGIFIALKALYHKFLIRQLFFITLSVFFHGPFSWTALTPTNEPHHMRFICAFAAHYAILTDNSS